MEDDDRNPKNRNETFKGTKSFIKQPKPAITTAKKMAKDEENNQSIKQTEKRIKFKEEQDNSNRYSEDFEQIPALSLDNNSTLSTSRGTVLLKIKTKIFRFLLNILSNKSFQNLSASL
jgi:hypothetical protein